MERYTAWVYRNLRRYLFNFESIILLCAAIVLYNLVFHRDTVKTLLDRVRIKFVLKLTGQYDNVPQSPETDLVIEKSKASWELRKGNVGVYAIQGRRPHMEDRFNVVNDLEHTNTSIYGIFDGHGGEVCSAIG